MQLSLPTLKQFHLQKKDGFVSTYFHYLLSQLLIICNNVSIVDQTTIYFPGIDKSLIYIYKKSCMCT